MMKIALSTPSTVGTVILLLALCTASQPGDSSGKSAVSAVEALLDHHPNGSSPSAPASHGEIAWSNPAATAGREQASSSAPPKNGTPKATDAAGDLGKLLGSDDVDPDFHESGNIDPNFAGEDVTSENGPRIRSDSGEGRDPREREMDGESADDDMMDGGSREDDMSGDMDMSGDGAGPESEDGVVRSRSNSRKRRLDEAGEADDPTEEDIIHPVDGGADAGARSETSTDVNMNDAEAYRVHVKKAMDALGGPVNSKTPFDAFTKEYGDVFNNIKSLFGFDGTPVGEKKATDGGELANNSSKETKPQPKGGPQSEASPQARGSVKDAVDAAKSLFGDKPNSETDLAPPSKTLKDPEGKRNDNDGKRMQGEKIATPASASVSAAGGEDLSGGDLHKALSDPAVKEMLGKVQDLFGFDGILDHTGNLTETTAEKGEGAASHDPPPSRPQVQADEDKRKPNVASASDSQQKENDSKVFPRGAVNTAKSVLDGSTRPEQQVGSLSSNSKDPREVGDSNSKDPREVGDSNSKDPREVGDSNPADQSVPDSSADDSTDDSDDSMEDIDLQDDSNDEVGLSRPTSGLKITFGVDRSLERFHRIPVLREIRKELADALRVNISAVTIGKVKAVSDRDSETDREEDVDAFDDSADLWVKRGKKKSQSSVTVYVEQPARLAAQQPTSVSSESQEVGKEPLSTEITPQSFYWYAKVRLGVKSNEPMDPNENRRIMPLLRGLKPSNITHVVHESIVVEQLGSDMWEGMDNEPASPLLSRGGAGSASPVSEMKEAIAAVKRAFDHPSHSSPTTSDATGKDGVKVDERSALEMVLGALNLKPVANFLFGRSPEVKGGDKQNGAASSGAPIPPNDSGNLESEKAKTTEAAKPLMNLFGG